MKTRYRIFLVISFFTIFYFSLIPTLQVCVALESDCTIWKEFLLLTRPVITSNQHIWYTGNGIGAWTGTADGIEPPSLEDQITYNLPFVTSMIVLPFVIIGFIVIWDRKK